jgi:hypothetical protein
MVRVLIAAFAAIVTLRVRLVELSTLEIEAVTPYR